MKTHMQTRQKLDLCCSEQRDAKNCQEPLEKEGSPGMESRRNELCQHPDSGPLASRTRKEESFVG